MREHVGERRCRRPRVDACAHSSRAVRRARHAWGVSVACGSVRRPIIGARTRGQNWRCPHYETGVRCSRARRSACRCAPARTAGAPPRAASRNRSLPPRRRCAPGTAPCRNASAVSRRASSRARRPRRSITSSQRHSTVSGDGSARAVGAEFERMRRRARRSAASDRARVRDAHRHRRCRAPHSAAIAPSTLASSIPPMPVHSPAAKTSSSDVRCASSTRIAPSRSSIAQPSASASVTFGTRP